MKRLKYLHPFGGKEGAFLAIGFSFVAGMAAGCCLCIRFEDIRYFFWAFFTPPAAAAVISLIASSRLHHADKAAIAQSERAVWKPVSAELLVQIRAQLEERRKDFSRRLKKELPGAVLGILIVGIILFVAMFTKELESPGTVTEELREKLLTPPALPVLLAAAAFCILLIAYSIVRAVVWRNVGEGAVYANLPISRQYTAVHHLGHGRTVYYRFVVCYQPDGRYIITAPPHSEKAAYLTVIRYRGLLCCMAFPSLNITEYSSSAN